MLGRCAGMDELGFFERQAEECRRAARDMGDGLARRGLIQLAVHYEREASRLRVASAAAQCDKVQRLPLRGAGGQPARPRLG